MEFSEFANTLWGILARGTNAAPFTRELFKRITDIPDDVDPNPIDESGDPTFKAYFTGDRRLTRFAPKIASYVDAELFVSYINVVSSDAQELRQSDKQFFVAVDKGESYTDENRIPDVIKETTRLRLSPGHGLFGRAWNEVTPEVKALPETTESESEES